MKINATAYVLLSGGQDSFVCLSWALKHFHQACGISIQYGQSHSIEIQYAKNIAKHFNVPFHLYDIGDFLKNIADSSLLNPGDHNSSHEHSSNLPASFIPNRNGLFLTLASNHAFKEDVNPIHLVTGTCQTDYSGYPDCRHKYIQAKSKELSLGLDRKVIIHTPLMWKTKAQTFQMADKAGILRELIEKTMTCYNGIETLHLWGRGCGDCPACKLREKGFVKFQKNKK